MASNVASGVGFVGAGVITTTSASQSVDSRHSIVHGLTTATAIWISAAIGVACGVGMFYISTVATASTVTILRFGRKKINTPKSKPESSSSTATATTSSSSSSWRDSSSNNKNERNGSAEQFHPTPDAPTRSMSLTTTVSLEKMNECDEWDSHYEKHDDDHDDEEMFYDHGEDMDEEDMEEEDMDEEDMEEEEEAQIPKQLAQGHILEHAHAASWGNVTGLVANGKGGLSSYKTTTARTQPEDELIEQPTGRSGDGAGSNGTTLAP
jgi:uncharacterized membrane protein YhiD involved in acid resistance